MSSKGFYTRKPVAIQSSSKDNVTSIFDVDDCVQLSHTTSTKRNQILTIQTDISSSLSHKSVFSHSNILRPNPKTETQLPKQTTTTSVPTSPLSYPLTSSGDHVQHFYSNNQFENSINEVLSSWPIQSLISCDHNNSVPQTFMSENKVQVLLENKEMWKKFDRVGNEMILSRTGRRMFPSVKVRVYGLEPTMYYFVLLDIVPKDNHRYTFAGRQWLARGPAGLPLTPRLYIHPDCPTSGSQLMKQSVSFHKVKLTNNVLQHEGHIYLNSMHKYVARVHIVAGSDILKIPLTCFNTFSFPETTFVAVTAYQNELVVKLKVDNNPFAKNFRFKRCAKTQMDSKCEEEKSREPLGKKTKLESFETHCSNGFEPENYQSGLTKMSHLVIPMNLKLSDSTINKMKNGSFASGLQNSLTSLNTGTETAITLHSPPSSVDTRTETTRLGNCRKTSTDTLLPPSVEMTSPLMATNHYRQLLMSLPFERNDYFSLSFNPHVSQFIPFNSAVMTSYFGLKPFSIPAFSGP